jgi:hypothetical protein
VLGHLVAARFNIIWPYKNEFAQIKKNVTAEIKPSDTSIILPKWQIVAQPLFPQGLACHSSRCRLTHMAHWKPKSWDVITCIRLVAWRSRILLPLSGMFPLTKANTSYCSKLITTRSHLVCLDHLKLAGFELKRVHVCACIANQKVEQILNFLEEFLQHLCFKSRSLGRKSEQCLKILSMSFSCPSVTFRIFISKLLNIWPEQCGWEWWGYIQYMPY